MYWNLIRINTHNNGFSQLCRGHDGQVIYWFERSVTELKLWRMAQTEIDNFISKFKSLVSAGIEASLKLNTLNSEVTVSLEANLGRLHAGTGTCSSPRRRGPSYFRRQQRRRNELSEKNMDNVTENVADLLAKDDDENICSNVGDGSQEKENVDNLVAEEHSAEEAIRHIAAEEAPGTLTIDNARRNSVAEEAVDKCGVDTETGHMNSTVTEEATKIDDSLVIKKEVEFDAVVYGTAIIDNSYCNQPNNEIYKAIWGIIDSKEHILKNVGKIRVVNVKSCAVQNSSYRHELQITFTVNSSRLWDSPRGYLWKHLGNSEWKLPDGSRVTFVRIHQK